MQKYHVFNEEFDQTDFKKWNLEMHFERAVQMRICDYFNIICMEVERTQQLSEKKVFF